MNRIRNERGGASLMYVTMIALVLMIVTPAILAATSNETLRRKTDGNALAASQLAVSAMETFLAYLYKYDRDEHGTDPVAYVRQYKGLNEVAFLTPEGAQVKVSITFDDDPDGDGEYQVQAIARVGTDVLERSKTVAYALKPPTAPSSGPAPDDEGRYAVPEEYSGIFVQTDKTAAGVPQTIAVDQTIANLETIIGNIIDAKAEEVNRTFALYDEGVTSPPPIVLKMGALRIDQNVVYGSSSAPVILIADSVTYSKKADVTVYGSLLVRTNVLFDGANSSMTVYSVGGQYGDMFVKGSVSGNNALKIDVSGDLYAGSMNYLQTANSVEISADTLTVQNQFSLENSVKLTVTHDVSVGSMVVKNNSTLTATAGDFLVETNFTAHNNVTISTGGIVASGGDFTIMQGNSTIETGGGTTSIVDIAKQIDDSGTTVPGTGWVIKREG
ncbi:hypothetical protein [Paenibacillus sp.]|uniref:hypothetical protein n=1 Tax=Paenibacillus sp. TaxID=58172 RepID=UPI002D2BEF37|nr:hypothetical protein [Paenibacillus sp.]HZG88500.1 hypothetical protein [Paenibacillus sp.]